MAAAGVEIVRRGYDAFNRADLDAMMELLDEWHAPPTLPEAGTFHGKDELRRWPGCSACSSWERLTSSEC